MKSALSAALFVLLGVRVAAGASPPAVPPIMQIGELPGQKIPTLLRSKERNPFTRRETKSTEIVADRESEESKLRTIFKSMSVTGVVRGGGDVKVLLENLILKTGQPVPPLLEKQTEVLTVGKITDTQIEIDFVESDERAEPRKILIPIDLHPHVALHIPAVPIVRTSTGTMRAMPAAREDSSIPDAP